MTLDDEKLLLAEYERFSESYWRNEEAGERRVNFFITLTTALIGAIVALITSGAQISEDSIRLIATAALFGAFLLGLVTFLRMLQRDRVTDEYKAILRYLREHLRSRSTSLKEYELPFRSHGRWWLKGGLAITLAMMNSFILAVIVTLNLTTVWRWLGVPGAFLVSFILQLLGVRKRTLETEPPSQTFRAGVGAVIVDQTGRVLALERKDAPGAWQLPQGGLNVGEALIEAVRREIREETGIQASDLSQISIQPQILAYELPKEKRSKKTGRGQVHYWFLFRYEGSNEAITLGDKKEFKNWKWLSMDELTSNVVAFKKTVYQELASHLARELGKST